MPVLAFSVFGLVGAAWGRVTCGCSGSPLHRARRCGEAVTPPACPAEQGPERASHPLAQDKATLDLARASARQRHDVQLSFVALVNFAERAEIRVVIVQPLSAGGWARGPEGTLWVSPRALPQRQAYGEALASLRGPECRAAGRAGNRGLCRKWPVVSGIRAKRAGICWERSFDSRAVREGPSGCRHRLMHGGTGVAVPEENRGGLRWRWLPGLCPGGGSA